MALQESILRNFISYRKTFFCIAKISWIFWLFEDKKALNFCWKVILIHIEKIVTCGTEIVVCRGGLE